AGGLTCPVLLPGHRGPDRGQPIRPRGLPSLSGREALSALPAGHHPRASAAGGAAISRGGERLLPSDPRALVPPRGRVGAVEHASPDADGNTRYRDVRAREPARARERTTRAGDGAGGARVLPPAR